MFVPSLMADMRVTFCSESFWRSFRPPFAGDIKARLLIPHLGMHLLSCICPCRARRPTLCGRVLAKVLFNYSDNLSVIACG